MIKDNNYKYKQFRKKFTFFAFEGFTINNQESYIEIVYQFNLADSYFFSPSITLKKGKMVQNELSEKEIEKFAFQIGMVELISYWKAACPQKIIIKPYSLTEEQIDWWKKLYFKGLGEFFYLNSIKADQDTFVSITSESDVALNQTNCKLDDSRVLVPIGGGKDSSVTLQLLKDQYECIPFLLNPGRAGLDTTEVAGFSEEQVFVIRRNIHPELLELNKQGFLNGHTPFSALLGFVTIFAAAITGTKYIALSNESSANEPTDIASGVNHQYSKSIEFESDFRSYVKTYLNSEIEYFSFLRPLSEYQIASIFSKFPHFFKVFRSCNAGSKTNSWCGKCPKCLFSYIILSPFIEKNELVSIFDKDLFEDQELLPYFKELIGVSEVKPFECVGTVDEVNVALTRTIEKHSVPLPYLLEFYKGLNVDFSFKTNLNKLDEEHHFLNSGFLKILKKAIN